MFIRFAHGKIPLASFCALTVLTFASTAAAQVTGSQRPILQPGESHRPVKGETPTSFVTQDLNQGLTPTDLVQALLGAGVSISNVTFNGAPIAAGKFSGGAGILGFDAGVVLGSGNIADIVGPNDFDDTSTAQGLPGDAELDALVPGYTTHDAAILEFDFQCSTTQAIAFNFVFTSEEFNEYVNSEFNDVFGFFLNGVNIALIPSTSTPVAINNVNCDNPYNPPGGSNCAFFTNNDCSDIAPGTFPCSNLDTEMDGLTHVFLASSPINPGLNHIKLAIADSGDEVLDSNVFIQASSLNCQSFPPPVTYCTSGVGSTGCAPAITSVGLPSASATNGFFVSATQERNRKPGLLLYGVHGRDLQPYFGGLLCVHQPLRRTPIRFASGNQPPADDCSGVLSIDMNAFASGALGGNPDTALAAVGTVVDCQWWSRDPIVTVLSDGLEYVVLP
jgi:hypothetical protein